ncbi:hypothetical protein F4819DRAFT_276383 [Hypoxylon fuscum]|nr:hypothetical protein F4819DRAFT_276383 [Hypoxylon fuscum]
MMVDFERSNICDHQPLGSISANRKRKHDMLEKENRDRFAVGMQFAMSSIRPQAL